MGRNQSQKLGGFVCVYVQHNMRARGTRTHSVNVSHLALWHNIFRLPEPAQGLFNVAFLMTFCCLGGLQLHVFPGIAIARRRAMPRVLLCVELVAA